MRRFEDSQITEGIQILISNSKTFNFLNDDEDLYSDKDLKQEYNG